MITARTLRVWRKEALRVMQDGPGKPQAPLKAYHLSNMVVRMTQELLDQDLLKK